MIKRGAAPNDGLKTDGLDALKQLPLQYGHIKFVTNWVMKSKLKKAQAENEREREFV